jgi:hypothetical protein
MNTNNFGSHATSAQERLDSVMTSPHGFQRIGEDQIHDFLTMGEPFSIAYRKSHPFTVFSREQLEARRYILNGLQPHARIAVVERKLDILGIYGEVREFAGDPVAEIVDAVDIGGSRAVFLLTLSVDGSRRSITVKEEPGTNGVLIARLLSELGWTSYRCRHLPDAGGVLLTDYLGATTIDSVLRGGKISESVIRELARHQVLGELLGAGDRHSENKIWDGSAILPLDMDYLWMNDNLEWSRRYIEAGMYEPRVLYTPAHDGSTCAKNVRNYVGAIRDAMDELLSKSDSVSSMLSKESCEAPCTFWSDSIDRATRGRRAFAESLLCGVSEMVRRQGLKRLLQACVGRSPECLVDTPWLEMFYRADRTRSSAFMCVELIDPTLLDRIRLLGSEILGEPAEVDPFQAHGAMVERFVVDALDTYFG